MKRAYLTAAFKCLLVNLCSPGPACAANDTTVAAALQALAYVPAANTANATDAVNARASAFATQPSPAAPPDGTPACFELTRMVNQKLLRVETEKSMQVF